MTYFASGARASMFDLAMLHAAARCRRIRVRGATDVSFVRRPDESVDAFHGRLVRGEHDDQATHGPCGDGRPLLAVLFQGDIDVPAGSSVYALFPEVTVPTMAASDLLS